MKSVFYPVGRWPGQSRPPRGAWVEMIAMNQVRPSVSSRAPHGARGLKYLREEKSAYYLCVAPPTGRVG